MTLLIVHLRAYVCRDDNRLCMFVERSFFLFNFSDTFAGGLFVIRQNIFSGVTQASSLSPKGVVNSMSASA